jgi:uncharacterized protein YdhG (YjbR/CyaY superfamily)
MDEKKNLTTIDEYIANYPEIKETLQELRSLIKSCVPDATEKISWGMPTFVLHGSNLAHFAVNKGYIGFYPADTGVEAFKDELAGYTTTKGSIHLPLNKPMPYDLIKRIIEYRALENKRYQEEKLSKKKKV